MFPDDTISIRDPLHGAIELERRELQLIEHPALRRLRRIKQLGFADHPYPGATHSRFVHSVGAMWMATRTWQSLQRHLQLPGPDALQALRLLRAAVLLHDIGHAPLSHTTETIMPPIEKLHLGPWAPSVSRQAHHEDYTLKLLLDSSLAPVLEEMDLPPQHLAPLISGRQGDDPHPFVFQGRDLFPILRQIVSSELDADRMDYLPRDAMFTGVAYGNFDLDWLVRHMIPIEQDGKVYLGVSNKAIFAFEDFLLSRYHMFHSVYYHHASVCYQQMLHMYYQEAPDEYTLPTESEAYLRTDDYQLMEVIRQSKNPWAQRIVNHEPYLKLLELILPASDELEQSTTARDAADQDVGESFFQAIQEALIQAQIRHFHASSSWLLSNYSKPKSHLNPPILVLDRTFDQAVPLAQYSRLYQRYRETRKILRIYVDPSQATEAQTILKALKQTSHLWLWNA